MHKPVKPKIKNKTKIAAAVVLRVASENLGGVFWQETIFPPSIFFKVAKTCW